MVQVHAAGRQNRLAAFLMSANDDIADGLEEVEGDIKNPNGTAMTFTWSGVAYPCSGSIPSTSKKLDIGGFELEADLIRNIRRSLFTAGLPALKQTGVDSVTGRTFHIEGIDYPPGFIQLMLIDPTKGA